MNNIFLITDTHFNHPKIGEYCNRPEGWEKQIIQNWKMTVRPEDIVIHLGDVMLCDHKEYKTTFKPLITSLPGKKFLVKGNHDKQSDRWYMDNGFDFCCDRFVMKGVLYSHTPAPVEEMGADIRFNIHGHTHNKNPLWKEPLIRYEERRYLLILENCKYKPVKLGRLLQAMEEMQIFEEEDLSLDQ